jgi:hypothetical protein
MNGIYGRSAKELKINIGGTRLKTLSLSFSPENRRVNIRGLRQ